MHDTISSRVDALSRRVLANDTFRKELEKLKQDILTDVKVSITGEELNDLNGGFAVSINTEPGAPRLFSRGHVPKGADYV